jgi:hypothetical protein
MAREIDLGKEIDASMTVHTIYGDVLWDVSADIWQVSFTRQMRRRTTTSR